MAVFAIVEDREALEGCQSKLKCGKSGVFSRVQFMRPTEQPTFDSVSINVDEIVEILVECFVFQFAAVEGRADF